MNKYALFMPTIREAAAVFGSDTTERGGFTGMEWRGHFVVITGMGMTSTATATAAWLAQHEDADITPLLAGIAGAYQGTPLNIGDICMIQRDYFVDNDSYAEFLTPFDGFTICSSNTVSTLPKTDQMAEILQKKTGAWLENMEGATFALACQRACMPAIQIRAVSNYCGNKENRHWNAKLAIKNLRAALESIL